MTRKVTNMILEMIENGLLDRDTVINACLKYMSEDDVRDMAEANEFVPTCANCNSCLTDDDYTLCSSCTDDAEEEESDVLGA